MACLSPFYVKKKEGQYEYEIPVGCGRCAKCRRNRINQWVFRLQQEDKVQPSSYFITLTYNTMHVPITENGFMTLVKTVENEKGNRVPHEKSFQAFIKRLRHYDTGKIKYYACGEYGSKTARPHYHAIVFGISDENNIFKAWQFGKAHIGTVTEESIAYTAKYIDKEPSQKIPLHRNDDRMKEFSLMSKKLGINYVQEDAKKYHKSDLTRNFVRTSRGYKVPLPRYFVEKLEYSDAEKLERARIAKKSVTEQERRARYKHRNTYKDRKYTIDDARRAERDSYYIYIKPDQNDSI